MGRLFGTDGVRGIAVTELTCELALQIGKALTSSLRERGSNHPRVIVGKDTRLSSDVLEAAFCAGICAAGGDAICIGVIATPGVAYTVKSRGADAGAMISASHNSMEFNGIKLYGRDAFKLTEERIAVIESKILDHPEQLRLVSGSAIGRIIHDTQAREEYISYLARLISCRLDGLHIAVDCANGAASTTAQELFTRLGAKVDVLFAQPDGLNINAGCGSTHIDRLMDHVASTDCQVGLAFDGDGDRCLAVDETGELVDGDKMIAIFAKSLKEQGRLQRNSVVVTVMSNLGFTYFAKEAGIRRITANVGDRFVLDKMLDGGFNLGGEQNGHIFFLDDATTGDGQLAGLRLLELMHTKHCRLGELACIMKRFPQVMINVRIPNYLRENWKNDEEITRLIDRHEEELGEAGRILVRESGTEPLIRVMIEGKDFNQINRIAMDISEKIRERVGEM